jgi:hypothetical protein
LAFFCFYFWIDADGFVGYIFILRICFARWEGALEIQQIIAEATEKDLDQYAKVTMQERCRMIRAVKPCSQGDKWRLMVLIDNNKAWTYCSGHAEDQGKVFGQTPILFADFVKKLELRREELKAERIAEEQRKADSAAERARAEQERSLAEQRAKDAEAIQKTQIASAEAFLAKVDKAYFKNWTEEQYTEFLKNWPESADCAALCGRHVEFVLFVPLAASESRPAELKAVCGPCRKIAELSSRHSQFGPTEARPYQAFRAYFLSRLQHMEVQRLREEEAQAHLRLKTYLKEFWHRLNVDRDEDELEQMIANMDPEFRATLQDHADAAEKK